MQLRQQLLDAVGNAYDVGSGLPLNVDDHCRRGSRRRVSVTHPCRLVCVLYALDDIRDILQPDSITVAIRNHRIGVVVRREKLVV